MAAKVFVWCCQEFPISDLWCQCQNLSALAGSSQNFYHENFLQRLQMHKKNQTTWIDVGKTESPLFCWCQTSLEAMEGQGGLEGFTFKLHCRSRSLGLRRAPQMEIDGSRNHRIPQERLPMSAYELWDVHVIDHSHLQKVYLTHFQELDMLSLLPFLSQVADLDSLNSQLKGCWMDRDGW